MSCVCVFSRQVWLTNCPRHYEHLAANASKGGFGYDVSSLKDRGKVSSDYDDSSEEQSIGAGDHRSGTGEARHRTENQKLPDLPGAFS